MSTDYQIPGRVPEDGTPRQAVSDYWRDRYTSEPYYDNQLFFDDYEPAYQIGHTARAQDMIRDTKRSKASWNRDGRRSAARAGWNGRRRAAPCVAAGKKRSTWTRSGTAADNHAL